MSIQFCGRKLGNKDGSEGSTKKTKKNPPPANSFEIEFLPLQEQEKRASNTTSLASSGLIYSPRKSTFPITPAFCLTEAIKQSLGGGIFAKVRALPNSRMHV
jgi:hypothetical protein